MTEKMDWKDLILTNSVRLCHITDISLKFLGKCKQLNVFTADELAKIESENISLKRNREFYDKLVRKNENVINSVIGIMNEEDTKQHSDVLHILWPAYQAGPNPSSNSITLTDTTENQKNSESRSRPIQILKTVNNYTRRSEIDTGYIVNNDTWVVSLARNAYRVVNDQHVFIILEGMIQDIVKIYFMDFTSENGGTIRYAEYEGKLNEQLFDKCKLSMMKIQDGKKLERKSYSIISSDGQNLVKSVKKNVEKPESHPRYIVTGHNSFINKSSEVSNSGEGHNCYSWACSQIRNLGIEGLQLPDDQDLMTYVAAIPGRGLPKNREWKFFDYCISTWVMIPMIVLIFTLIITSVLYLSKLNTF